MDDQRHAGLGQVAGQYRPHAAQADESHGLAGAHGCASALAASSRCCLMMGLATRNPSTPAGTPAYTAACSSVSWISSGVQSFFSAARTWMASSVARFSALSMAILSRLRVLRGRPGRLQISPQQYSVASCCMGWLKASAPHSAVSIFSLPSRSEEHTSELQSLMRISYAVFCLKKKTQ